MKQGIDDMLKGRAIIDPAFPFFSGARMALTPLRGIVF